MNSLSRQLCSKVQNLSHSVPSLSHATVTAHTHPSIHTLQYRGFKFQSEENQTIAHEPQRQRGGGGGRRDDFDFDFDNRSSRGGGGNFRGGGGGRNGRFNDNWDDGFQKKRIPQINWFEESLTPFRKDFYQEHPTVESLSETDVTRIRKESAMTCFGNNIPKPFSQWEESNIPGLSLEHLQKLGINEPSPIQAQGIPMALSGRDIVGVSRTGSGKTLAYLLPAIVHIQAQPIVQRGEGPIGLILAPTRELTQQINNEIGKFVRSNPNVTIKHTAVFGGADRHKQISDLRTFPDILVATPGRLIDLLQCGETNFKRCTYLVLDEADRMLDMGFRDDLETILSYVRPDRQVLMWSATWPKEIQSIADRYTKDPIRVQIGSLDLAANENIEQYFKHVMDPRDKMSACLEDIEEIVNQNKKVLVFTNMKVTADDLENQLRRRNINARSIHGGKTQSARESILRSYRNSELKVLIATNVVSRGIDIRDIAVVLVYDFPTNVEDYVHRIGRTGRAGDKGMSLSYVTDSDIHSLGSKLVSLLKKSKQKIPSFLERFGRRNGY